MLRDAGVRTKLLAVLAIPTLLLAVVTGLLVANQVTEARRAGQINALTEVAVQVNAVVHSLQEERSITLNHLQSPSAASEDAMVAQRRFTDRQLRELDILVEASPVDGMPEAVRLAVARSTAVHGELTGARASVDAGRFFATETDVFYGKVIRADLDLPGVLSSTGTAELGQTLEAYQALSRGIEYASHERDLVEVAIVSGGLNEAEFAQASAFAAQQREALQDFQGSAPAAAFSALEDKLAGAQNYEIDQVRRQLPDLLKGSKPDIGAAVEWVMAANSRISAMTNAESSLVNDIARVSETTQLAQERRTLVLVTVAVLGLGLALMLAIGLARRITRPLRRLTVAAGDIGAELPRMVERMQTPGEGPGVVVEPIPVESADEIGRLAQAFNTVNDVTVQVAKEQAALRSSIAEMFVNVARRNQVLLGRQLKALDQMEAGEEDPDVLERLFTLDHLATRMRRNAESLLVLAGIDATRRLRSPLPLSDVIRTAVGEIEAFDRIDLSMSEDPDVSGRYALTVAHLLAELLENSTHFSNPETRVVVAASLTGHGVDVTVTDYGLGMSEEEIADANERIAHPPVAEIAVSQRLGLFVVGRLAARLGATVQLRRGRTAGTVVTVSLPQDVFEGLAVDEVEPVVDEVVDEVDVHIDEVVDEPPVEADQPVDEVEQLVHQPDSEQQPAPPKPARRWSLPRRSKAAAAPVTPVPEAVEPVTHEVSSDVFSVAADHRDPATFDQVDAEPVADDVEPVADEVQVAPVADEVAPVADEVEVEPVADEVEVEPVADEPVIVDEPVARNDDPPSAPKTQPEPEPQPEPVQRFQFAAAVDILPGPPTGGRFGRQRHPLPPRQPAPVLTPEPVHADLAPAAPVAPVPVAAPIPVPTAAAPVIPDPAPVAEVAPPVVPAVPDPVPVAEVAAPVAPAVDRPPAEPALPARRAAPAEPVSVGAGLQSRGPVASSLPQPSAATEDHSAALTARSDLTSSALSELRGLYEPSFAPALDPQPAAEVTDTGLVRRTRKATPTPVAAAPPPPPARSRSASDVRGMLSGFRAGVERGRAPAGEPGDDQTSDDRTS